MEELKNTINNFFKNRYTRSEYFNVLLGFKNGDKNQRFIRELENQWDSISRNEGAEFNSESSWNRLNHRLQRQNSTANTGIRVINFIRNIAAFMFVPLLVVSALYYFPGNKDLASNAWAEIKCPAGVRTEFELPDGSKGVLNCKSTLKYPVNFKGNRAVLLTGEAFFDVVKSKSDKFTVSTSRVKVEVLGTSFNVMAYDDELNEEVTLKTGEVKILDKDDRTITNLVPNQQFLLNTKNNQYLKKEVNAQSYTSWIAGKLVIQNERFEDIGRRLSRWYNVDIEVEGAALKDFRYYATFVDEPLDEVLRLIQITAPIEYQEGPRARTNDGSFSRQKIKFKLDENRINDFK